MTRSIVQRFSIGWITLMALSGAASAADIFTAPVTESWTGFYGGLNIGYGFGQTDVRYMGGNDPASDFIFEYPTSNPLAIDIDTDGVLGGVQLGYNWQASERFVFGVEADFQLSGIEGSAGDSPDLNFANIATLPLKAHASEELDEFGTVRARLGYLIESNFLIYGTGGLAFGNVSRSGDWGVSGTSLTVSYSNPDGSWGYRCNPDERCFKGSDSEWELGWTAGAGAEYALDSHWTVGGEYLYASLPGSTVRFEATDNLGTSPSSFDVKFDDTSVQQFRFKVNYRFN